MTGGVIGPEFVSQRLVPNPGVELVPFGRIEEFYLDDLLCSSGSDFRIFSTLVGPEWGHLGEKICL
jgi:hypothetical protein